MARAEKERVVDALLARYGRSSFAEQAEIHMKNYPHALYQIFQLAALTDAGVDPEVAVDTFTAPRGRRWSTAGQVLQPRSARGAVPAKDAKSLRRLVRDDRDFVRLVDALVQVRHDKEGYQELQELAGAGT